MIEKGLQTGALLSLTEMKLYSSDSSVAVSSFPLQAVKALTSTKERAKIAMIFFMIGLLSLKAQHQDAERTFSILFAWRRITDKLLTCQKFINST